MAGSCAYCGTPLDQNGLCPNCGNENETTGLLTPEETPAFYTQAQGQSPAPGGHAPAYPAPGPAAPAYPQAAPGPVAPAYPQAAPDPVAPAYHKAAPGPAAPPKPKKNGGGKKIALAVGVAVLAVGLLVGLLFVLGVIRLPEKGDPLADEIFFLVTPAEHIRQDEKNGTFYADNELLVVARPGVKKREMETVAARHNATVVGCIEMTGDYQLQLETQMSPEELDRRALAIASEPEIESAARNTVIPLRKTASAPEGAWTAEASPASGGDAYWNLRLIRATDAWGTVNAHVDEIRPVAVGMIADGAPADHPDIPLTQHFFTANGNAAHALAVAGIMAADGTNEDGFSGVYPFARDRFYAASAEGMGVDGVSVMWEKAALAKLIVSGAKVLNCGYTAADEVDLTPAADALGDYLDRTLQAGYDFLIVTSSVNGEDAEYSAALNAIDADKYPDVFARILVTGGADKNGLPFDGEGVEADARLDLLAPLGRGTPLYTTLPGGYGYAPDWSDLCAPHVSGAAALVWSADNSLTGDAVKRILLRTAQANALLDVNAAVTYTLENKTPAPADPGETPADEPSPEPLIGISPEEAVDLYLTNKNVWWTDETDSFMSSVTCLFLDLDADGVLELVRSDQQGSGRFSYNDYYRIDPDTRQVVKMNRTSDLGESSDGGGYDFVSAMPGSYPLLLKNKSDGSLAYFCHDFLRVTTGEYDNMEGLLYLRDGVVRSRYLFSEYFQAAGLYGNTADKTEYRVFGEDGSSDVPAIPEAEYREKRSAFLAEYEDLHLIFRTVSLQELGELTQADLRQTLLDLYLSFDYDGFRRATGPDGLSAVEVESLYHAAQHFYDVWLTHGPQINTDAEPVIGENGGRYYPVFDAENWDTAALKQIAGRYFGRGIFDDKIDSMYVDQYGRAYANEASGQGGDVGPEHIVFRITDRTAKEIRFSLTLSYPAELRQSFPDKTYDYVLHLGPNDAYFDKDEFADLIYVRSLTEIQ